MILRLLFILGLGALEQIRCDNSNRSNTFSGDECAQLGFKQPDLVCTSCDRLAKFSLNELKEDCRKCCTQVEGREISKKYPKAIFEVCACKFGHLPQIEAFCRSDRPSKFPGLTMKYLRGADPVIKLIDEDGQVADELNIKKWDTDTIEEFLSEMLL